MEITNEELEDVKREFIINNDKLYETRMSCFVLSNEIIELCQSLESCPEDVENILQNIIYKNKSFEDKLKSHKFNNTITIEENNQILALIATFGSDKVNRIVSSVKSEFYKTIDYKWPRIKEVLGQDVELGILASLLSQQEAIKPHKEEEYLVFKKTKEEEAFDQEQEIKIKEMNILKSLNLEVIKNNVTLETIYEDVNDWYPIYFYLKGKDYYSLSTLEQKSFMQFLKLVEKMVMLVDKELKI